MKTIKFIIKHRDSSDVKTDDFLPFNVTFDPDEHSMEELMEIFKEAETDEIAIVAEPESE